jgi:hypothetical protein
MAFRGMSEAELHEVATASWPTGPKWDLHRAVLLGQYEEAKNTISAGMKENKLRPIVLWYDPEFVLLRSRMNELLPIREARNSDDNA